MVLVLYKTEEFRGLVAASRIKRYEKLHQRLFRVVAVRAFPGQIQAVARISHKTFLPPPCLSLVGLYDQSNAFSFCDFQLVDATNLRESTQTD